MVVYTTHRITTLDLWEKGELIWCTTRKILIQH